MNDYLTKPLRPDQLDAVLERWLGHSATAPARPEPLVDEARIRIFVSDYPDIVDRLVALFADSTPPLLEQLTEASARDDAAAVASAAHKLKGSCDNVGASAMAQICRRLEEPGAVHPPLVEELQAAFPATLAEIRGAVAA